MRLKINKYVCYRYESKIKGGKCFIFDLDKGKIYLSNKKAFSILEYIDFNKPSPQELETVFNGDEVTAFLKTMNEKGVLIYEY